MEAVKSFNQELMSLYDVKPPISKAKMTAITRGAIKAIKFYKHVVQSVEKFILKCKSEYKVPGLYVIDSIVRQSRHQFGSDKDVFAPRFAKNMQQTFLNLFKCPPEDKSKIIRVLNLWQKNNVFQPEVIQPLFDLADPNNPIYKELGTPAQQTNGLSLAKGSPVMQRTPTKGNQPGNDSAHGQTANLNLTDPNVLQQLQQLQRLLTKDTTRADTVHFDKKLLDFDYGDEDDDVNPSPRIQNPNDSVSSLLANPEVLRQLQTLQQTMTNAQQPEIDLEKLRKLQEMKQQEDEFDKHLAQTVPNLPFASDLDFKSSNSQMIPGGGYYVEGLNQQAANYGISDYDLPHQQMIGKPIDSSGDVEVITLDHDDSRSVTPNEERYKRRRSRSRSRDRRGRDRDRDKRKRSRTRSGSRSRRHRSRSRDRERRPREKDKEKEKDTEKERERKKRGLPVMKKDHLSVCSTTLWVGHLSKLVHQDDLSNTFGEFGDVVSIDLIPPRGCAFIVMLRRQDAARCLNKLKGHALHGKAITLAWAPGKGVKGKDLKDYWEGDLGVSYIPYNKIKEDIDLDALEDGSMIDEDTMPLWMKEKMERAGKVISMDMAAYMMGADSSQIDTSQPPPMPGAGLLQPPPPMLPLVSPFQFNNRLLGMNVPPNMMPNLSNMPNIPLGVPPPNMAGNMMSNQMLGINSPFQGPNMMAPPQLPGIDNKPPSTESNLQSLSESLMSITQPYGMVARPPAISLTHSQEDNMDIEMEDAEKPIEKANQIGDHLQQIAGYSKPHRDDEKRDRRDGRRNRSRDRDRDRDRDRRDRREDRDRRDSRGRDRDRRDERRGRDNRWGDRDRERERRETREAPPPPEHREERRDREKTLNDRLREMAGMGNFDDTREKSRDRHGRGDRRTDSALKFEPPPGADMGGEFKKPEFEAEEAVKDEVKEEAPVEIEAPIVKEKVKDIIEETEPVSEDFTKHKDLEDLNDIPDDMDEHINRMGRHAMEGPPMMMLEGPSDWPGPSRRGDRPAPLMDEPIRWNEMGDDMDMELMEGPPHLHPGPSHHREGSHMLNGPPHMLDGPPHLMDGPPHMMDGPPHMMDGPPHMMDGPPHMMDGPPHMMDGPPHMMDGPPHMIDGPSHLMEGPPHLMDGPPHLMDGPPHLMDGPPGAPDMIDGPPYGRMGRFRDGRRDFPARGMRGGQRPEFFPRDGPRGPMMRGGPGFGPRGPMMAQRGPRGFFNRGPRPRGPFRDFSPRFEGPPEYFRGPGGPPRMRPPIFEGPNRRPRFEDRKWSRAGSEPPFDEPERPGRRSRWGENQDEETEPYGDMEHMTGSEEISDQVEGEGEGGGTPVYDECPPPEEVAESHEVNEIPPVQEEVVVKEDQKEEVTGEGTVE